MKNYIPLPEVNVTEHGLGFGGLGLPVGFKDEEILVDMVRLEKLRSLAGLGIINVIGTSGDSQKYSAQISSVNERGEATLGLMHRQRKNPIINGVSVTESGNTDHLTYEPDVTIRMDISERNARIDDKDSPRRNFDPEVHAQLINHALTAGITEAAKQRYNMSILNVQKAIVLGVVAMNIAIDTSAVITRDGVPISLMFMLAFWGGFDVLLAKAKNVPLNEANISMLFGLDRCLGGMALAKVSRIVVAKP